METFTLTKQECDSVLNHLHFRLFSYGWKWHNDFRLTDENENAVTLTEDDTSFIYTIKYFEYKKTFKIDKTHTREKSFVSRWGRNNLGYDRENHKRLSPDSKEYKERVRSHIASNLLYSLHHKIAEAMLSLEKKHQEKALIAFNKKTEVLPLKEIEKLANPEQDEPILNIKKEKLVFIHRHGDLDAVSKFGGDLLARGELETIVKDIIVIKSPVHVEVEKILWIGFAGIKKEIYSCYVVEAKNGYLYCQFCSTQEM